jgi:hypothetical protein
MQCRQIAVGEESNAHGDITRHGAVDL